MRLLIGLLLICLSGCSCGKLSCWNPCGRTCGKISLLPGGDPICCEGNKKYWRCVDKWQTKKEAKSLASQQLNKMGKSVSCDFRYGYEDAFVDIAMGACGDVPPLPPALYWKVENRTPKGHARAQDWFAGYAAGANAAKMIYEPYNDVGSTTLAATGCPIEY